MLDVPRTAMRFTTAAEKTKALIEAVETELVALMSSSMKQPEKQAALEGIRRVLEMEVTGVRARAALANVLSLAREIPELASRSSWDPELTDLLRRVGASLRVASQLVTESRVGLSGHETEWRVRSLVIADFDKNPFLGLPRWAKPRELALLSILAGSLPGEERQPLSVAEMIRLEEKAMRMARARLNPFYPKKS